MPGRDVIDAIVDDHDTIRALLDEVERAPADERDEAFRRLVTELARHEAAEEALVHAIVRDEIEGGRRVAESVLEQESSAEQRLADLEKRRPSSEEFLEDFRPFRDSVLTHAAFEEREEHPRLREALSDDLRRELAAEFARLRQHAPTHPHPKTPQTPEVRAAVAPVARVFDQARDQIKRLLTP